MFGPDISNAVAKRLNAEYIVRSHQPFKAESGPCIEHGGRVVTISSTSVYGGRPFVLEIPADKIPANGNELKNYAKFI